MTKNLLLSAKRKKSTAYKDRYYNPYKIGQSLYERGYGLSDIWSAVNRDSDVDEAVRGYNDAKAKNELQSAV